MRPSEPSGDGRTRDLSAGGEGAWNTQQQQGEGRRPGYRASFVGRVVNQKYERRASSSPVGAAPSVPHRRCRPLWASLFAKMALPRDDTASRGPATKATLTDVGFLSEPRSRSSDNQSLSSGLRTGWQPKRRGSNLGILRRLRPL